MSYIFTKEDLEQHGLVSNGRSLPYNPLHKERAKIMRKNMTKAECKVWFDILKKYDFRVLRQQTIDHYIVDFYIASCELVIEIDGDTHVGDEEEGYDKERTKILEGYGLTVLRFTNKDVFFTIKDVEKEIFSHIGKKLEGVPPQGEGLKWELCVNKKLPPSRNLDTSLIEGGQTYMFQNTSINNQREFPLNEEDKRGSVFMKTFLAILFLSLLFLRFSPSFSASLGFSPQEITVGPQCPVIVNLMLGTKHETNAIDIKIIKDETLYTVRDFSLSGGVFDTISDVMTGTALSGTFAGQEYYYAFGMMQADKTIIGDVSLGTMTVVPAPGVTTVRVPLYMIPSRAGDDSTVSHLSGQIITDILQYSYPLTINIDESLAICEGDNVGLTTASGFSLTERGQHNTSILSNISLRIYLFVGLGILLLLFLRFFAKKRSSD